jgi:hypothetical protein
MTRPARTPSAVPTRPGPRGATATGAVRGATGPVRTAASTPRRTGPVPSRPQLRLVPPTPAPTRARGTVAAGRRAPFVLLVVLMLAATTVSLLLLNTAIAVDSLEANQRRAAIADQAQQVERLEQQVLTGSTAAELARDARAAGLVPSGAAAHLVLGADGTSAVRGEAVPAEAPVAGPAVPGVPTVPTPGN